MSTPVSGMPAMDALTLPEVRDMVAWLATLDKAPKKPDGGPIPPMANSASTSQRFLRLGGQ